MDRNQQLGLLAAFLLVGGIGFALGAGGFGGGPADDTKQVTTTTTTQPTTTTTRTTTVQSSDLTDSNFGLVPLWEDRYDGSCAGCHMANGSNSLHDPPLHPVGLSPEDNEHWFWDHDQQAGPSVSLENRQRAGISPLNRTVYCSDCHSVGNPDGFADPASSNRTLDPHAVHENTVRREGCERCHSSAANASTMGVDSPIDMTRGFDHELLASRTEAPVGPNGSASGSGWAVYGQADSPDVAPNSCGDCHGQYHEDTMNFSYSDETNVGPPVEASGGVGIRIQDTTFECGDCHTTNVHAVHTNGQMNRQTPGNLTGVQGAESCLECHGVSIAERSNGHYTAKGAIGLGLFGEHDELPDAVGYKVEGGDCGFCHENTD